MLRPGDAIDHSRLVVADIESAIGSHGQADRAANGGVIVGKSARGVILGRAGNPAIGVHGNKDNLEAGGYTAVPRAMKRREESMIALGKMRRVIECRAKGGGGGLHLP